MTDPVNNDAALVREAITDWSRDTREWKLNVGDVQQALARLAAAAERADEAERDNAKLDIEFRDLNARLIREQRAADAESEELSRQVNEARAALLVAQQERDDLERERLRRQEWNEETLKRAEQAEATNTRLREAAPSPARLDEIASLLDLFAAALAQDAEQENA